MEKLKNKIYCKDYAKLQELNRNSRNKDKPQGIKKRAGSEDFTVVDANY